VKFFYIISDAQIGPAREGGSLTRKTVAPQHMMHVQPAPQEQLLEGVESPAPTNNKSNEEQK
ncbi:MAG: hypothetical protein LDL53_05280, partial [Candidatus Hydrogenedens sp.]|nr:hypothetical protein [Candidatus Hydrogenedens sp.]